MKKLESLKSSKFEAFKGNEIENSMRVIGGGLPGGGTPGTKEATSAANGTLRDTYDKSSEKHGQFNDADLTWVY